MTAGQAIPDIAYKIVDAAEWASARVVGVYRGSEVDRADGFIHLSTRDQFDETAAKHYRGRANLLCLAVDLAALGDTVRWEPSRGGALFPHIYGPLPAAAVVETRAMTVSDAGAVTLSQPL